MTHRILDIVIADKRWGKIPHLQTRLEQAVQETFRQLPKKFRIKASANLLLTTDAVVKNLNRDFRGKDQSTNVLSFPQYEPAGLPLKGRQKDPIELGDIAIAYQYMVCESKKYHKILINHLIHLTIHGLLHLLGYDHLSDTEAAGMEGLETRIMAALDLPDPYLTRHNQELKQAKATGKRRRAVR